MPMVATDPESTPASFRVFFSDPDPESKIKKKTDPVSLFFDSNRSRCDLNNKEKRVQV